MSLWSFVMQSENTNTARAYVSVSLVGVDLDGTCSHVFVCFSVCPGVWMCKSACVRVSWSGVGVY